MEAGERGDRSEDSGGGEMRRNEQKDGEMEKTNSSEETMGQSTEITEIKGSLLVRNTLLNFIGKVVPLLAGVVIIPFIVRGLGTERFGLLSLSWAILSYFTLFDLGLGKATTKYVAEALAKGKEDWVPSLVWTAVTVQTALGIVGFLILVGITPVLVQYILNIPQYLWDEAKATFYLLAFSVPAVLISGSFQGALEARQRFDLVNIVKITFDALTFLMPLVGLRLGFSLPGIMVLILLTRFGALIAFVILTLRIDPRLTKFRCSLAILPNFLSFGGWITVFYIINPFFMYTDRFLIGSLVSISAVAYYSAPFEIVNRLRVIPASLTMTLFPAFTFLASVKNWQRIGMLFTKSVKYTLLSLSPVILVLGFFANEILEIWLGFDFAAKSTVVLQILTIGILTTCIAYLPHGLLLGIGRPDIPVKFNLIELPIYIGIAWVLINQWGIVGAAAAWTFRLILDSFLLFIAVFKLCPLNPRVLATNGLIPLSMAFLILSGIMYGWRKIVGVVSVSIHFLIIIISLCSFAWAMWKGVLDSSERKAMIKAMMVWKTLGRKLF